MQKTITKRMFADALLSLSKKKPYEKITISDIITECGAGRQTFYNHFQDKDALVAWIVFHSTEHILSNAPSDISFRDFMLYSYKYMLENKQFYERIYRMEGQHSAFSDLLEQMQRYHVLIVEKNQNHTLTQEQRMSIRFFCYGSCYLFRDFLMDQSMCSSVEELVDCIINSMPAQIKPYYKGTEKTEEAEKSIFQSVHEVEKIVKGIVY